METSSSLNSGVWWELALFWKAFLTGFFLRMSYDGLLIGRRLARRKQFWIGMEDFFFWLFGCICMFALLYRENNGTPRLFAIVAILGGMLLYQCALSRLVVRVISGRMKKAAEFLKKIWKISIKCLKKIVVPFRIIRNIKKRAEFSKGKKRK